MSTVATAVLSMAKYPSWPHLPDSVPVVVSLPAVVNGIELCTGSNFLPEVSSRLKIANSVGTAAETSWSPPQHCWANVANQAAPWWSASTTPIMWTILIGVPDSTKARLKYLISLLTNQSAVEKYFKHGISIFVYMQEHLAPGVYLCIALYCYAFLCIYK